MSWEDLKGWFAFRDTYDLAVSEARDGDVFVEIGVAFGRSFAYLARRVIDSGKKVTVYGVDPLVDDWWMPPNDYPADAPRPTWGGEHAEWARSLGGPFPAFCSGMLEHAREELGHVRLLREYSSLASRLFENGTCAMVMIDGNHNLAQVRDDIARWRWKVREGGILAGDDYSPDFPGVVQAVHEAFGDDVEIVGTTWRRRM
jgi:hypothetical protein